MPCPVCGAGVFLYEVDGGTPLKYVCGYTQQDVAAGRHPEPAKRRARPWYKRPLLVALLVLLGIGIMYVASLEDHSVAAAAGGLTFTISNDADQEVQYSLWIGAQQACAGRLDTGILWDDRATCTAPVAYPGRPLGYIIEIAYENGGERRVTGEIRGPEATLLITPFGVEQS